MNMLKDQKTLVLTYICFVFWILLVLIINKFFAITIWNSIFTFLLLIFLPGFSLYRIFRFKIEDFSGKIVLWIGLGFTYTFVLMTLAILIGLTINSLLIIYIICQGLIFLISLILDCFSKPVDRVESKIKIFEKANLIFIPIIFVIIPVFIMVVITGANFAGDPAFHLTIVRKAFGGQALLMPNLAYLKNTIHLAYGFPIWHVFIALLAKLQKIEVVTAWYLLPPSLFWLALATWYFLFKQIFNSRLVAILSLFFFIVFYVVKNGYIFTRLTVPDTFATLILLPLLLGLILKYVFGRVANLKLLILIFILIIFLILIHATHYFYLLTIMSFFALAYGLGLFWEKKNWSVLKKILLILLINFCIIGILLLVLQLRNNMVSDYINMTISNGIRIYYRGVSYKWIIFVLILLLFAKKNSKISFLVPSFVIIPFMAVILWQQWIVNIPNIGLAYMQRLKQNVYWLFAFWGLVLGFIILLLDRMFTKIQSKAIKFIIYFVLSILIFVMIWSESKSQKITQFYQNVINQTGDWIIAYLLIFVIILGLCVIGFLIIQFLRPNFEEKFDLNEPKNSLFVTLLVLFSFVIIFSNWRDQLSIINRKSFDAKLIKPVGDRTTNITNYSRYGGKQIFNFIGENVPPKSVFLVPESDTIFAILADQYMAAYLRSQALTEYLTIYDPKLAINDKLTLIKKGKIDYILLTKSNINQKMIFENYPNYFKNIYNSDSAVIYRVEKSNL